MLTLPAVLNHAVTSAFDYSAGAAQAGEDGNTLQVDAGALVQFDSSALAVVLECRRQALAAGKAFSLCNPPPRLLQLAGVYGVDQLIAAPLQPALANVRD